MVPWTGLEGTMLFAALLIAGAEVLPETAYQRIVDLEQQAEAQGYAKVA